MESLQMLITRNILSMTISISQEQGARPDHRPRNVGATRNLHVEPGQPTPGLKQGQKSPHRRGFKGG